MSRIVAIDRAFKEIIDDFTRVLPLLNKKDPEVKQVLDLVNKAIKIYAMQISCFAETANMLFDTLNPSYELIFFAKNPIARAEFLKQSRIASHPLKRFIEPLVKTWQLDGDNHE